MTNVLWCVGLIALVANCAPLGPRTVGTGDRVRVHATRTAITTAPAPVRRYTGTASSITPVSITVTDVSRIQSWTFPASSIHRLYVSDGRRSRAEGALGGAVIGGLVLATFGAFAVGSGADMDGSAVITVGGVSGIIAGGLVGLALGGRERWRPATLPVHSGRLPTPADVVQVEIGASPVAPPARSPNDGFRAQVPLDLPAPSP